MTRGVERELSFRILGRDIKENGKMAR